MERNNHDAIIETLLCNTCSTFEIKGKRMPWIFSNIDLFLKIFWKLLKAYDEIHVIQKQLGKKDDC